MARRFLTLLGTTAVLLLLSGCEFWTLGGHPYTAPKGAFTIRVPAGWSSTPRLGADLLLTRDGALLHAVTIDAVPLKQALPHTDRPLPAHLSPYELAETVAGDLRSDPARLGLNVLSNEPASLDGVPGFKLTLTYLNEAGLRLLETRYGAVRDQQLWTLLLRAPQRHYHARDLPVFEATVASFRFGPSVAAR